MAQNTTSKSASPDADQSYDELRAQLDALRQDLAGLTDVTRNLVAGKAQEAADGAKRMQQKAARAAEHGYDVASDQVDDAIIAAETFARDRPALAMGLAAAAGFVLAKIVARR